MEVDLDLGSMAAFFGCGGYTYVQGSYVHGWIRWVGDRGCWVGSYGGKVL